MIFYHNQRQLLTTSLTRKWMCYREQRKWKSRYREQSWLAGKLFFTCFIAAAIRQCPYIFCYILTVLFLHGVISSIKIGFLFTSFHLKITYSLCPKNIVCFLESWKMTNFETPYLKTNGGTGFKFRGVANFDRNYSDVKFESRPVIRFWDMRCQSLVFLNFLETVQYFLGQREYILDFTLHPFFIRSNTI